jgi:membrane-associated HD superfamily phosphohydrolase
MWRLLEIIALAAVVLVSVTEFFYPLLTGKPFFGSFRKTKKTTAAGNNTSLDDKLNTAKAKVEEIKNVQNEVDDNYKTAEQLKEESDKLLNNPKK